MRPTEDCQQTISDLELFLDGELPDEKRQQVLDHLDACMECFHTYDLQAELKQIIAAKCANEPLPADLVERIRQSLSNETA
jgi:anti-sigma factor (TIGR02949 family)